MPQGANKPSATPITLRAKRQKPEKNRPQKNWKKKRDPVKAALIKKAEACAMEQALRDPMKGGMKTIKPTEEKAKLATVRTKDVIKQAQEKARNK